jgi:transcriptional regulator GlxA family with amidase domain
MGVEVIGDRVVWQGTHISGAGVSAGIDMALSLTERVHRCAVVGSHFNSSKIRGGRMRGASQ